jgi:AraC family transcriptional regulator
MAAYIQRLMTLLDHLDAHTEQDFSLVELSQLACLSRFHFHRQFTAFVGMTPGQYCRALRFRRVARQLVFRQLSITDIAFAQGYESLEAFSRAFKDYTGQSPGSFRKTPDWQIWHQLDQPLIEMRKQRMQASLDQEKYCVELSELPSIKLAVLEHRGPEYLLGKTIQEFIAWRKQYQLSPANHRTFNLIYEDPASLPEGDFRLHLAVEIKGDYPQDMGRLTMITIPAGVYASIEHRGNDQGLEAAVRYLYQQWLPESTYELRDFPLFFERVKFFPDVAEHQAQTRIYLPLTI